MAEKIKNPLFRFASLRAPQLLESEEKIFFAKHPDGTSGTFFTAISGLSVKRAYTFSPIVHDMTHELKDWVDQGSLAIILTEYYMDDDYDEIRDFAEEEDLEDAEIFIKKMKLPRGIDVEAQFLDW
jgi:hypothetical protein